MENGQRRYDAEPPDGARSRQLSAVEPSAAQEGAGLVVDRAAIIDTRMSAPAKRGRPPVLADVPIPGGKALAPRVRTAIYSLFWECGWLTPADLPGVVRWARLSDMFNRLAALADKLPPVRLSAKGDDAQPRAAWGELRALDTRITALEAALGVTASARAALGVNVARLGDLAELMAEGGDGR